MSSNYGSSGHPFDQKEIFTFEEAARALVFDRTGKIVPALESRLTPLGNEFHDWLAVLKEAVYAETNPLHVSVYSEESWHKHGLKACVITREQLRDWCNERGMQPRFLTPAGQQGHESQCHAAKSENAPTQASSKPVQAQRHQESEILRVIMELGYQAKQLPKDTPGKPGVKAAVRAKLKFTNAVFDKAWERLSSSKDIVKEH